MLRRRDCSVGVTVLQHENGVSNSLKIQACCTSSCRNMYLERLHREGSGRNILWADLARHLWQLLVPTNETGR